MCVVCLQERAARHDRGAGGRGDQLPLHPPGPPRRGVADEAGGRHHPLRRRAAHPRRRPQRARRHRLLRRALGRHRQGMYIRVTHIVCAQ